MRRQPVPCAAASRRRLAAAVCLALFSWILIRFCYEQFLWHRRETTLDRLDEGPYRVVRVIDWQTLLLAPAGASLAHPAGQDSAAIPHRARVRLIGISAPAPGAAPAVGATGRHAEAVARRKWQDQATGLTRNLVSTGMVRVRLDLRRIDASGVFLAYVFVGDRMLNEELVRAGLARVHVQPRDSSAMVRRLRQAQTEARDAGRGIWSVPAHRSANL